MKLAPRFLEFAWRLELALRVMRTFDPFHPRVAGPLSEAYRAFQDLVKGKVEVQFALFEGRLFVNDEEIDSHGNPNVGNLVHQMQERDLRALILGRGLDLDSFRTFVALLALSRNRLQAAGGAQAYLKAHPSRHLQLAEVRYQPVQPDQGRGGGGVPSTVPGLPGASNPPGYGGDSRVPPGSTVRPSHVAAIQARLEELGLPPERLQVYMATAAWEGLDEAGRVKVALQGETIFSLPPGQVLDLLGDLLSGAKVPLALEVLAHLGTGLFSTQARRRQATAELVGELVKQAPARGFPAPFEASLFQLLRDHFAQERDPKLMPLPCEALASLLGAWLRRGRLKETLAGLDHLGGSALIWVPGAYPWKKESLEGLCRELATAEALHPLVARTFEASRESLQQEVYPLLVRMGEPAAAHILRLLDQEPAQGRRKRLMDALRAIGLPAVGPLRKALASPHWHLVRNVVNCLKELGDQGGAPEIARCLHHEDVRVRGAAARALRDLGAKELLLASAPSVEARTRSEVLLALGHLKVQEALPFMRETAASRGALAQRFEALRAMGQLEGREAVAALASFLRGGGVFRSKEEGEVRWEALRVLRTMATPEARWAAQAAVDGATGADKDDLQRILLGGPG